MIVATRMSSGELTGGSEVCLGIVEAHRRRQAGIRSSNCDAWAWSSSRTENPEDHPLGVLHFTRDGGSAL